MVNVKVNSKIMGRFKIVLIGNLLKACKCLLTVYKLKNTFVQFYSNYLLKIFIDLVNDTNIYF